MRDYDARDPRRKAELNKLLESGEVTQPAVNHAGHCDGGARGGGCLPPLLSYSPLAAPPSSQAPSERPFERRPNPNPQH